MKLNFKLLNSHYLKIIWVNLIGLCSMYPGSHSGGFYTFENDCGHDCVRRLLTKSYLNFFCFFKTELACRPVFENNLIQFKVSLRDVYKCGLTKVTNQGTVRV